MKMVDKITSVITMHHMHENAMEYFHSYADMKQGTMNSNSGMTIYNKYGKITSTLLQFSRHVRIVDFEFEANSKWIVVLAKYFLIAYQSFSKLFTTALCLNETKSQLVKVVPQPPLVHI